MGTSSIYYGGTSPLQLQGFTSAADPNATVLNSGFTWSGGSATYSFPDAASDYLYSWMPGYSGFMPVSLDTRNAARYILEGYSPSGGPGLAVTSLESFTNLNMNFAGYNGANIRIGASSGIDQNHAFYPGIPVTGGDVWLKTTNGAVQPGTYAYHTLIHELGHALGLDHGHDTLTYDRDSVEFSVMTYREYVGSTAGDGYVYDRYSAPQTFMMYDISALQSMYGADFATNSGDSVYRWDPATGQAFINGVGQGRPGANKIFLTIWDGGGIDTYDFSNYHAGMIVDLSPGGHSLFSSAQRAYLGNGNYARGNVFNALQYNNDVRSLIENAVGGAGADTIKGNVANNKLTGNGGNDRLSGEGGRDMLDGGLGYNTLEGGAGDDTFMGGAGVDQMIGGTGVDLVNYSSATAGVAATLINGGLTNIATGDRYTGVEGFWGSGYNDQFTGDAQANLLYGMSGDDVLIGGTGKDRLDGGAGADSLHGGADSDELLGGTGRDIFVFNTALSASSNVDWMRDFQVADDLVYLSRLVFTTIGSTGTLAASRFKIGSAASAADHRIVYNSATGELFYDADGSGAAMQTKFAMVKAGLALTAGSFYVI